MTGILKRVKRPVRVVDLRDSPEAMLWGVVDGWGVVIAQFDSHTHATLFCEFFTGQETGSD